jgi:hypothetical protein
MGWSETKALEAIRDRAAEHFSNAPGLWTTIKNGLPNPSRGRSRDDLMHLKTIYEIVKRRKTSSADEIHLTEVGYKKESATSAI